LHADTDELAQFKRVGAHHVRVALRLSVLVALDVEDPQVVAVPTPDALDDLVELRQSAVRGFDTPPDRFLVELLGGLCFCHAVPPVSPIRAGPTTCASSRRASERQ